jgi:peroxiredoxin
MTIALGAPAPDFTLPDTSGNAVALDAGTAPATVVIFTCNHCPYALAWHERLDELARDYSERGVRVLQINANDAEHYPRDSLEAMHSRVTRGEFSSPYLHDADQSVARGWGAQTTPDVFVLDGTGTLVYRGAPDADYQDESLRAAWVRNALDHVLAGETVSEPETKPVGCSIKWKP